MRKVAAELIERSRILGQPSLLGRRPPEFPRSTLREILAQPCRLIYAETNRGIEIVTVMHYRHLLPETLGRRA